MSPKLGVLQRMARRWGGDIVVLDGPAYRELVKCSKGALLEAPFIDGHCIDSLRMAYAVGWTDSMHAAPGSDASVHEPAAWVAVLRYLAEHHGDTRCRDLVR